ncbi:MAG TPA: isoprenylcysteine carboxylmethyltransferase family protein [Nitrospiraceae bacterium]|nr:isoprenylcysteine carboxylmethyltransferase family protein [Nitrospiraceae bacterium]
MTALKSLSFLILVTGLGAVYIPFILLPRGPQVETGIFAYLAFPLWLVGGVTILWCFWVFAFKGHGTPAPIDPPRELVTTGFYRYVRNPICVGALIILIGHFLWFKTIWLPAYAVVVFLAFHLFVTLYEEPTLKKKFGIAYEDYRRTVPRWIPRIRRCPVQAPP